MSKLSIDDIRVFPYCEEDARQELHWFLGLYHMEDYRGAYLDNENESELKFKTFMSEPEAKESDRESRFQDGWICLSDFFSCESSFTDESQEAEFYTMIYGKKSLTHLRTLWIKLKEDFYS